MILGAAVIDDIVGLVILSIVGTWPPAERSTWSTSRRILALAVGFLVMAVFVGNRTAPAVFGLVHRMRARQTLAVLSFAFVLAISALATMAGSALIIGAFAGGLILSAHQAAQGNRAAR